MTLTITEKQDNILLGRTRIQAELSYEGVTPSNTDVTKQVSSALKTDEKLVCVRHIYTAYRSHKAIIKAYVYKSEDALKKNEITSAKKREADKKSALETHQKAVEEKKKAAESAKTTEKSE